MTELEPGTLAGFITTAVTFAVLFGGQWIADKIAERKQRKLLK